MAFHYLKKAAQETASTNKKRQRFFFDEIESGVLSEEDDNILVGPPRGKLIYFDACTTTKPDVHEGEVANPTTMRSETVCDVLGKRKQFL